MYDRGTIVKSDKDHVHHALNGMTIWEAFSIRRSQRAPMCYSCVSYLLIVFRCLSLRIVPQNRFVTPCSSKFTLIIRTVHIFVPYVTSAGPSDRARGLRRGYAVVRMQSLRVPIPPVHLSVVCCQVEACVAGRSLVERSLTKCGVSECDRGTS